MTIIVYGTPTCPNCDEIKKFLSEYDIPFAYQEVGKDIVREELELVVSRPVRSVPVITLMGEEISADGLKEKILKENERVEAADLLSIRI